MTKEELQIKVGELDRDVVSYKKSDEKIRTELSKLLGAGYIPKKQFDLTNGDQLVYSWLKIAFEIGKLKTFKRNVDLGDKVNNLEDNLSRIENNVGEDIIKIDNRLNKINK